MRTLHLFAGAGGGILADIILGHEPIAAVEIDPYACRILRERFPGLRVIEGDIKGVDFRELAGVDALCAGFPCQDISSSGRGSGIYGKKSSLFFEILRAIDNIKPQYVFLENSPLIRRRGRHVVTKSLVERGYCWRDGIFAAADVGAPHIRERWFLLAKLSNSNGMWKQQSKRSKQDEWRRTGDVRKEEVAADSPSLRCKDWKVRQVSSSELRKKQSQRLDWWSTEPGMGRMVDGLANRPHRVRCLGNGQVPLVAALAWRLLSE